MSQIGDLLEVHTAGQNETAQAKNGKPQECV